MSAKFRALQPAWVFDNHYGCDRLVKAGDVVDSDLDLDVDKAIPTGESPDSSASKIFERLPDES